MSKKELKTNAMRILDRAGIPYTYQTYECGEFTDGVHVADQLGLPHERVYKTLVTVGRTSSPLQRRSISRRPQRLWGRNPWRCSI